MQDAEPSRTALAVARHRAAHQVYEHGRIFRDPLALRILGLAPEAFTGDADAPRSERGMRFYIAARSRFAENCLTEAVARRGVRQVVVLGAGLDTFAYRHEHGDRLRVFEVDHPASQTWKRRRLADAQIDIPKNLVFAPVDFEREELDGQLAKAGLERSQRTFFIWLGVVPYLTTAAVQSTLRFIARLPGGAELAFDYGEPAGSRQDAQRLAHEQLAARVASVGEPFLSYFEPPALHRLLEDAGFRLIDDLSVRGLAARLFGQAAPNLSALPDRGGHVVHAATAPA